MKNPYYAKPSNNRATGHWVVMQRISAANGGGSRCVDVYTNGPSPRDAARRAARALNAEDSRRA